MTRGLLLINLGSPQGPAVAAVKRYLNQFLTDPYVVDLPAPIRQIIVKGLITPLRADNSAHAYQKIWTPQGSPLVHTTKMFADLVQHELGQDIEVRWAMRYGNPSLKDVVKDWKTDELMVVPLYPQYAESSTKTAIEATKDALPIGQDIKIMDDFYASAEFINSEARVINRHLKQFQADHLLLSFHGLPEHHMRKLYPDHCLKSPDCCDHVDRHNRFCYRAQAVHTYRLIADKIEFPRQQVSFSFQSRLGRRPWIKPYTDLVVGELIQKGVKKLAVACPSFVADNLETLEEVRIRLKEQFIAEGGEDLYLIPSLNIDPEWVSDFCTLIKRFQSV